MKCAGSTFDLTTALTRPALCCLYSGAWRPGQWSLSEAQPERPLAFSKALWGPKVHDQQTRGPNITQHLLKKIASLEERTQGVGSGNWASLKWG